MTEWTSGYVNANGLKIHYYRTGGARPPVIFNHGAGEDGLCGARLARDLQDDYDVILPDARGHGKSASGKGDYTTPQRVADLLRLVQELNLERPIIGGHSLGADTALNFAVQHPALTRAIFLEDPPIYLPGEGLVRDGKPVDQAALGKQMTSAMRLFKILPSWATLPLLKKAQPAYPDEELRPMAAAQKRVSFDFINRVVQVANDINDPVEIFEQVPVPVLLIIGDRDKMSIVSQEGGRRAMNANPKVEVVHLAGASHNIRRDQYDGYLRALKTFLHTVAPA